MNRNGFRQGACAVATLVTLMASGLAHAELKAFYTFDGTANDVSGTGMPVRR